MDIPRKLLALRVVGLVPRLPEIARRHHRMEIVRIAGRGQVIVARDHRRHHVFGVAVVDFDQGEALISDGHSRHRGHLPVLHVRVARRPPPGIGGDRHQAVQPSIDHGMFEQTVQSGHQPVGFQVVGQVLEPLAVGAVLFHIRFDHVRARAQIGPLNPALRLLAQTPPPFACEVLESASRRGRGIPLRSYR